MANSEAPAPRLPFDAEPETTYPWLGSVWNLVLLGVAIAVLGRMPGYPAQETLFARFVCYPMAVLAAGSLVRDAWRRRRHAAAPTQTGGPLAPHWGLALGAAYLLLLELLGFAAGTVIFLTGTPLLLGQPLRRTWVFLVIGAATAALFLFFFQLGSGIVLPAGLLGVGL